MTMKTCPRCDGAMAEVVVGGVDLDECSACRGLFVGQAAIQHVIADPSYGDALLAELPRAKTSPINSRMYVKCPVCREVMNRKQFATGAGVVIDVCRRHGTFFDVGELPAIVEFVMAGGLAKAQQKDLERLRDQARQAESDARAAAQQAAIARSYTYGRPMSSGYALVDLLELLML
jgi:Zn-finger nucleic acid-binding protein